MNTTKLKSSVNSMQGIDDWRDLLAKITLFLFGIVLWHKGAAVVAGGLLTLVWILCGGLCQLKSVIKEPLSVALLSFCSVLLVGVLWSDYPNSGHFRWAKYLGLMVFIPYISLLNKDRLFWGMRGLVIGYIGIFTIGIYYNFYLEVPGIPFLKMAYLHFSLAIGAGVLLAIYWAGISENRRTRIVMWGGAYFLLFVQFNLSGRGPLLATVITLFLLLFLLYRRDLKKMMSIMVVTAVLMGINAYGSSAFQERFTQIQTDIGLSEQGDNQTSVGQRRAFYEIGLNAIAQRPWLGYGTGMAQKAFEVNAKTYMDGRYKDVANFKNLHFHSDLIEMGVYLGLLGISAYIYLLWGWLQSLRVRGLTVLGATLVSFIFMAGLTDVILIYGQIPSVLLASTAIAIVWQREYGALIKENGRFR